MRAKTRIGNYLVTLEANKGILLLQPFIRNISWKDILCMKCHMGLPHCWGDQLQASLCSVVPDYARTICLITQLITYLHNLYTNSNKTPPPHSACAYMSQSTTTPSTRQGILEFSLIRPVARLCVGGGVQSMAQWTQADLYYASCGLYLR